MFHLVYLSPCRQCRVGPETVCTIWRTGKSLIFNGIECLPVPIEVTVPNIFHNYLFTLFKLESGHLLRTRMV